MKNKYIIIWLFFLFFASSCQKHTQNKDSRPMIVCTTTMIADLARRISAGRFQVRGIMKPGEDPHIYDVRPYDAELIRKGNIIFTNGLHLEATLTKIIHNNLSKNAVHLALGNTKEIQSLRSQTKNSASDPHIWMSVRIWKIMVLRCAKILIQVDPKGKKDFEKASQKYLEELTELDLYIRKRVAEIQPQSARVLITSHDAFQYFGREYGVQVHGVIGISTGQEPRPVDLEKMIQTIKKNQVKAIFMETSVSRLLNDMIQKISQRSHVKLGGTLFGDSLGDKNSKGSTYLKMMRFDVDVIVDALR